MIETAVLSASIASIVNGSLTFVVWKSMDRRFAALLDRNLWGLDDMETEIRKIDARWGDLDYRLRKLEIAALSRKPGNVESAGSDDVRHT